MTQNTGRVEGPALAANRSGRQADLFNAEWLLAFPVGNRVYVQVRIGRQPMQQILQPESDRLRGEILGVVGRSERFKIPMRSHSVADPYGYVVVGSGISRSLIEQARAQLRLSREKGRRIVG